MSAESDRLRDPAARRFHGYEGDRPIHLGRHLHVDVFDGGRYFVAVGEVDLFPAKTWVSRDELVAAARDILEHFNAT